MKSQKLSSEDINRQIYGYLNQIASSIMTANVQAKVLELNDPELAKRTFEPAHKPASKKVEKEEKTTSETTEEKAAE